MLFDIYILFSYLPMLLVRKDLIDTFHKLFIHEAFAKLDWILIETTGLANPAPLIQSLYMDMECSMRLRLDSVLTMIDAKYFPNHLKQHMNKMKKDGMNKIKTTFKDSSGK